MQRGGPDLEGEKRDFTFNLLLLITGGGVCVIFVLLLG